MNELAYIQPQQLPRVYSPTPLAPGADLLQSAIALARNGAEDATLLHGAQPGPIRLADGGQWLTVNGDLALAVIVRSELEPLQARQVGLVMATALGQAIADRIAPLTLLQLRWPTTLLLNEGVAGKLWVHNGDAGSDWTVIAACLNLAPRPEDLALNQASLSSDGGVECAADTLLLDTSRRFLRLLNQWVDSDLRQCAGFWRNRLVAGTGEDGAELTTQGDLQTRDGDQTRLYRLADLDSH